MQCTRPPEPAELPNSALSSDQPAAHGQKRSNETEHSDSPKPVKFADASFSLLEILFLWMTQLLVKAPKRRPSWMKMQSRKA